MPNRKRFYIIQKSTEPIQCHVILGSTPPLVSYTQQEEGYLPSSIRSNGTRSASRATIKKNSKNPLNYLVASAPSTAAAAAAASVAVPWPRTAAAAAAVVAAAEECRQRGAADAAWRSLRNYPARDRCKAVEDGRGLRLERREVRGCRGRLHVENFPRLRLDLTRCRWGHPWHGKIP